MRTLKHLPLDQWPAADHEAFRRAYMPGDLFDGTAGPGAHLSEGSRQIIRTAWRRWLGFLAQRFPDALDLPPADRIASDRVRAFIQFLCDEVRLTSAGVDIDGLTRGAALIAPERDWTWLRTIRNRLVAAARPEDRFPRLVPPARLLDLGIRMMEEALQKPPSPRQAREIHYRDGLIVAFLSLYPVRRRSLAALTLGRHVALDDDGVTILLEADDTKSGRSDSVRFPKAIARHFRIYIDEIRPRFPGADAHDGLWASRQGRPLCDGQLYSIARKTVGRAFDQFMGLHDFRRAAGTYLATTAPEKIGLLPGVLQHATPEVGERHYNLARSLEASRRYAGRVSLARAESSSGAWGTVRSRRLPE